MKRFLFFLIFSFCFVTSFLRAGERSIPVDIFLMIDKSLSMEDPGKFDSLRKWVLDELVDQMLIKGDWITIYQFYKSPEHLITLTIEDKASMQRVYNTIATIKPDGQFTDIGLALDTMQYLLDERGSNGHFKVLLLLSDLIQDAPWTSKYRGKQDSFKSPYLVEARIIKHDNWYEITLDMDIQDVVVQRTQSLYSDVIANEGLPRSDAKQNEALIQGETTIITKTGEVKGSSDNYDDNLSENEAQKSSKSLQNEDLNNVESDNPNTFNTTNPTATETESLAHESSTDSKRFSDVENNDSTQNLEQSDTNENIQKDLSFSEVGNLQNNSFSNSEKNVDQKPNIKENFFQKNWFFILAGVGILLFVILILLLILYLVRENNRKKEAERKKIDLV